MNKKIIWGVVVAVVVIGLIILGVSNSGPKFDEAIKIGFASSLSGEAAVWGESLKKGFDFAVEEVNKRGGIGGYPVEIIYEDDQCDAKTGLSVFNKLIDIDNVDAIVGTVCSSVAMAVADKVDNSKVVYMASGATNPEVPKLSEYIFRAWVSDAYESIKLAEFAVSDLGLTQLGIGYFNDNPAGISLKDNFSKIVSENSGLIVSSESFTSETRDFRSQITKMISSGAEGLYLVATPEQTPLLVNQVRDLGFQGSIFLYSPSVLAEGVINQINTKGNLYYTEPKVLKETDFWQNYEDTTEEEANLLIALGYDSFGIVADGILQCGKDSDCIKNAILSLNDYQTTRGPISYDEHGDLSEIEFEIREIK